MREQHHIKVMHIASGDLWAGAEVQLFTLAMSLQKTPGIDVSVVLLNHGKLERELHKKKVKVFVLDENRLNSIQILRQLVITVKEIKPDIVHTHRTKENVLGSMAALLHGNIPSLRTMHGAPEHRSPWRHVHKHLIRFMDWFCGRYLQQKVIAVSNDLGRLMQREFPAEKIQVIENGIDINAIDKLKQAAKADTSKSATRVAIAGRLVRVKRVDIFIETAAVLMNHHPDINVSFHIFGDGPLRAELEDLADKLLVKNIVKFEGHCENMPLALRQTDILLITSDHEGLPMILLESMALKVPVIAHATGGIPEVLKQGDCGVLVTAQNSNSYADAVLKIVNDSGLRASIVRNAFSRVSIDYSSEKNASSYHSVYKSLAKNYI